MTSDTRRAFLSETFAAAVAAGGRVHAETTPPSGGVAETWLRLVADTSGRSITAVLRGDVWGFLPQADNLTPATFARRLYGYWSLVERTARPVPGGGFALTTRGCSFYLHPMSGEITSQVLNPYTGEMVTAKPLSGPPSTVIIKTGGPEPSGMDLTIRREGDTSIVDIARISRFTAPDITWFKLEADFNTHRCQTADLDDRRSTHVPSTFSHNLVAEWQTWMKMHGAPGHILFRGAGSFVPGPQAAPSALRRAIAEYFPAFG